MTRVASCATPGLMHLRPPQTSRSNAIDERHLPDARLLDGLTELF